MTENRNVPKAIACCVVVALTLAMLALTLAGVVSMINFVLFPNSWSRHAGEWDYPLAQAFVLTAMSFVAALIGAMTIEDMSSRR